MEFQLELQPILYRLITVWISTGILFFFFKKYFWSSMKDYLEKRKRFVSEQVELAKISNQRASQLELEVNEKLKQARIDSKEIVDKSRNEAIKVREQIIKEAKIEASNQMESAQIEIAREKDLAKNQIESQIVDVALLAASKIVKENIDDKQSRDIVDDFIKDFKS